MSEKWYLFKDGRQIGPLSRGSLEQMVRTKELIGTDLVINDQMKEWIKAETVSGLFATGAFSPPPPLGNPTANSSFSPPPVQFTPPPPMAADSKSFNPPSPAARPVISASSFKPDIGNIPAPGAVNQGMGEKPGWQKLKIPIIIGSVVILIFLVIAVIASLPDEPNPMPGAAQTGTQPSDEITPLGIGSSSEQPQASTQQGVKTFNEPGYGFTMNYPQGWAYTIDEEGSVIFQGAQGSDDFYNIFMVMLIPTSRKGGTYNSLNDVFSGLRELYDSMGGEILASEEVEAQIGNSTHQVLQVIAIYDSSEGSIIEVSFIIERDSNYYYQLLYSAPEEISEAYIDMVMTDIVNTFSFTDF